MFADPEHALDTLVREELGLDPDELGSWGAAGRSFVAFGVGAIVPIIPYLLTSRSTAFLAAIALSIGSLFAVGAGVKSLLRPVGACCSPGLGQVLIGSAAAVVTYLVGHAIRVAVWPRHLPRRGSRPVAAAGDSRDGPEHGVHRRRVDPLPGSRQSLRDPVGLGPVLHLQDVLLPPLAVHRHDRDETAAATRPTSSSHAELRHQPGRIRPARRTGGSWTITQYARPR